MERVEIEAKDLSLIHLAEEKRGDYFLACEGAERLLFTENETNFEKIYGGKNQSPFVKDGINDFVVNDKKDAVNTAQTGTKAAAHYVFDIVPQASETIYLRLFNSASQIPNSQSAIRNPQSAFERFSFDD